jgi:hypothetical protein
MPSNLNIVKVPDLAKIMAQKEASIIALANISGVSHNTISRATAGRFIQADLAVAILTTLLTYHFKYLSHGRKRGQREYY